MQDKRKGSRPPIQFKPGDEVAYAMGKGMRYGTVVRIVAAGDQAAVEIEFEDGGREVHRSRDRALSLLRRASGESARDEETRERKPIRDNDIAAVRRSEQKRRW